MKSIVLFVLLSVCLIPVHAQSAKFTNAMLLQLKNAGSAHTADEMQAVANGFARIAEAEKTEWTAWYYAAFYNLMINFQEQDKARKGQFIALAQQQIDRGLSVKPGETELMVLKILSYYSEMSLDPMKAMSLFPEANALIDQAKTLNPDNPRIYLEQAEAIYNMPVEYGGGKESARPILLLAKEKFDKFVPADQLAPNWGKDRCYELLGTMDQTK
jgi:hypothetical protein